MELEKWVPEGPSQAVMCKELVCWSNGVLEPEKADEGKEAKGVDKSKEMEGSLEE